MRLYEYIELYRNSFSWDVWTCFWEDFNYFIAKDFARLGLYYLKELREQLQEEYRPPWTNKDDDFERLMTASEPPPEPSNPPRIAIFTNLRPPLSIEAPVIEAPPTIELPVIEAPIIEAPVIEPPVIEALVIEAPQTEALPIEASPVDTNERAILAETDELEHAFTSTIDVIEAPVIEAPVIEALIIEAPVIEVPQTEALLIEASPVDTILVKTDEYAFTSIIGYCFAGSSIPESLSTTTLTLPLFSIPATELGHSYSL
ncbi:hypothetical protein F5882DRAFT_500444 [Hyaloscypha sp. PMI_1271]|nr:hypothetical protein F5882DRAFT_500444 [Hyaloscypha sp. PMI_1271]